MIMIASISFLFIISFVCFFIIFNIGLFLFIKILRKEYSEKFDIDYLIIIIAISLVAFITTFVGYITYKHELNRLTNQHVYEQIVDSEITCNS